MFERLERVLYRSADITVTTRRVKVHGGSEYAIRDIKAILPEVAEQWVIEEHPDPVVRRMTAAFGIVGVGGLFVAPGIAGAGHEISSESGEVIVLIVSLVAAGLLVVLSCIFIGLYWWLYPRIRTQQWRASVTFYLKDGSSETIRLISPLPLDDAVAAIEEALAS